MALPVSALSRIAAAHLARLLADPILGEELEEITKAEAEELYTERTRKVPNVGLIPGSITLERQVSGRHDAGMGTTMMLETKSLDSDDVRDWWRHDMISYLLLVTMGSDPGTRWQLTDSGGALLTDGQTRIETIAPVRFTSKSGLSVMRTLIPITWQAYLDEDLALEA